MSMDVVFTKIINNKYTEESGYQGYLDTYMKEVINVFKLPKLPTLPHLQELVTYNDSYDCETCCYYKNELEGYCNLECEKRSIYQYEGNEEDKASSNEQYNNWMEKGMDELDSIMIRVEGIKVQGVYIDLTEVKRVIEVYLNHYKNGYGIYYSV